MQNNTLHSHFDDHRAQHLIPANNLLVGFCTRLLAKAIVSASQSPLELIDNALHIVRVAFRIGIKVNDAAQRLSIEINQSWSRLVLGAQKEASIAKIGRFNEMNVRLPSMIACYSPQNQRHPQLVKTARKSPRKGRASRRVNCPNLGVEGSSIIILLPSIELRNVLGLSAG